MMRLLPLLALSFAAALATGCTAPTDRPGAPTESSDAPEPAAQEAWQYLSSGEGDGLHLLGADGKVRAILFCPVGGGELIVNIPGFHPVASEERMSIGAGSTVTILVADPAGDGQRGGVSGAGPVPVELAAILAAPAGLAVNYGYQNIGPFTPVAPADARAFLAACAD